MSYYLRFEGVNLSHFIYDTNDLSTIRGGGLLLLDAVKTVQTVIKATLADKFKTITQGASWALFELETDKDTAIKIKQTIIERLNRDEALCHATFVIDVLEKTNKYKIDRDSLHALNRWQQMQSPSLSIPKEAETVCELDKVRPASVKDYGKNAKKIILSASVFERRKYGRDQKQNFYKERTKLDLAFTNDLEEISKETDEEIAKKRGILKGKIAVIYVDGNKFGSIAQSCKDAKEQTKFDTQLRDGQNHILNALLIQANGNDAWKNNGRIRLETLLWGGDELIWVVPAWLGWQTLNLFFEQANDKIKFTPDAKYYSSPNGKLSFAAGLVFCHHNAPIHRITKLAKDLAELAKDNYHYQNAFAYQILESFDHAGIDIKAHRIKRLANLAEAKDLLVTAENMAQLEEQVQILKNNKFPRRKSYQIIKALLANDTNLVKVLEEKIAEDFPSLPPVIDKLKNLCGTGNAYWLHLTDLWDYIALAEEE